MKTDEPDTADSQKRESRRDVINAKPKTHDVRSPRLAEQADNQALQREVHWQHAYTLNGCETACRKMSASLKTATCVCVKGHFKPSPAKHAAVRVTVEHCSEISIVQLCGLYARRRSGDVEADCGRTEEADGPGTR
ncbi:hypothetical protein BaRGS_00015898 [Batillaria attramentaria]|uniref:Extracellular membrane protein CFEM domain-containing protein n=1 Tax=Batillaria attramentaria TaxID=370345 RepID=A0ABD0L129_9CAEN